MRCFEIAAVKFSISEDGGPFVKDDHFTYAIDDEAQEALESILNPYDLPTIWLINTIDSGRPRPPWAIACLDREYAIAGHIATSRIPDADIKFAPYNRNPGPVLDDVAPGVGALFFYGSRDGLERSAGRSPVFAAAWDALRECPPEGTWLVILDPLSQEWLDRVLPGDRERWLDRKQ